MKDVKPIIAENLVELRKSKNLTQGALAEELNYSDKAISRWEKGETLPDINVLCQICDFYGISLNDLTSPELLDQVEKPKKAKDPKLSARIAASILTMSIVWLVAIIIFIYGNVVKELNLWITFVWAVPITLVLMKWTTRKFNKSKVFANIVWSFALWTFIAATYLTIGSYDFWMIFLLGIPFQIIVILYFTFIKDSESRFRLHRWDE